MHEMRKFHQSPTLKRHFLIQFDNSNNNNNKSPIQVYLEFLTMNV